MIRSSTVRRIIARKEQIMTSGRLRTLKRRGFLKGMTGLGGGMAVLGIAGAVDTPSASAQEVEDNPTSIFSGALIVEQLTMTLYHAGLTQATFALNTRDARTLRLILAADRYHDQALRKLGGLSFDRQFHFPTTALADRGIFVGTATVIETSVIATYLAATRRLATLGQPRLAASTAQFAASHAAHLASVRQIGGLDPSELGLPAPIYFNASDGILTHLTQFWNGGPGFVGPLSTPSAQQLDTTLGLVSVTPVPTFVDVF
jgi:hypothetical protein